MIELKDIGGEWWLLQMRMGRGKSLAGPWVDEKSALAGAAEWAQAHPEIVAEDSAIVAEDKRNADLRDLRSNAGVGAFYFATNLGLLEKAGPGVMVWGSPCKLEKDVVVWSERDRYHKLPAGRSVQIRRVYRTGEKIQIRVVGL